MKNIKKADKLTVFTALAGVFPLFCYTVFLCCAGRSSLPLSLIVILCVLLPPVFCFIFGEWAKRRFPKLFTALRIAYICIGVLYAVSFTVFSVSVCNVPDMEAKSDVYIVFGCRVKNSQPSWALELRLQKALQVLTDNPDATAVLSGGQGDDEDISEAKCMFDYLTSRGIDESRLILEDKSTSTEENIKFSIKALADAGTEYKTLAAISNDFHINRIITQAESLGCQMTKSPAKSPFGIYLISNLVREYMVYIRLGL